MNANTANARLGLRIALAFLFTATAHAQPFADMEPNNACPGAQVIASGALPVTVIGSLDSDANTADIDFFRVSLPPGELVQIDLEGASTSQGSLGDPLIGVFDGDCNLIALDDDGGFGVNSRLQVIVPDGGDLVVAATSFPDFDLVGGGIGSYRLKIDRVRQVSYIAGRIVDANSGQPLAGFDFPFASAILYACDVNGCENFVAFLQAGLDGTFRFEEATLGYGLTVGTYQVRVTAVGYIETATAPFDALEDEGVELGDIPVQPLSFIGSVSGTVIDGANGAPLPGFVPPFPVVELQRCEEFGCIGLVSALPDFDGRFHFEGPLYQLIPGDYRVIARADDYLTTESAIVGVGTEEHVDLGDVAILPRPIRLDVAPCVISPRGLCQFDVLLTNRGADPFPGLIWSLVEYYGAGPQPVFSRFQIGARGVANAGPRRFSLAPDETRAFPFSLWIPQTVPAGYTICVSVAVGKLPGGPFDPVADRFAFCSSSPSFEEAGAPALKGRELRRSLRRQFGIPD